MKEMIMLCLAVYGLTTFAQNTQRTNVNTVPNTTAAPNAAPNSTTTPNTVPNSTSPNNNGSMNSNVPPINTPHRTNVNDYPSTRARDAARQGMPSRPTSSDSTQRRTN